jgi:phenylpropionate dioxygenase-like ring-hydroxylating dioxygenase large terminal subunit
MTQPRGRNVGRQDWSTWPTYAAASHGLRDYWYPVMWSRELTGKPKAVTLLGTKIVLGRDGGEPWALADRCPHRGVPLSLGTREFPGTISCPYHGWTFDVKTGGLCAVITDGPDSPMVGKASVTRYPTAERLGLVWVYLSDQPEKAADVPPVEAHIPAELTSAATVVVGRIEPGRRGNWRYATENGFDEGHAKFLHRKSLWTLFRQLPVWNETKVERSDDGEWVIRRQQRVHWEAEFPGLGRWTQARWWKRGPSAAGRQGADRTSREIRALHLPPARTSVRTPGIVRVVYPRYIHYEWAVAETADTHRYVQLLAGFTPGWWARLWFRAKYLLAIRWIFHGQFTGQDAWMVNVMDVPPERLYRPDASVLGWRKFVEDQHNGKGV